MTLLEYIHITNPDMTMQELTEKLRESISSAASIIEIYRNTEKSRAKRKT